MKHRLLLIAVASLGLLQGCAGVFIAGAATTASVANDRRTVGSVLDDQNIELKAADAIASRKDMNKASRISATSVNGKVLLVGQTPYSQYSRDAEKLVAKISGVRQVYNELRIRKPIGFADQSNDSWITSKIKSTMLTTKGIDSTHFKVVTESGEVFLMGLVTCASLMPVDELPPASWVTTFFLGFVSAVFDNIPLTKLCLEQGGYDWGVLAYAVGFGGSMLWFGSSAGVALSNMYPEARSAVNWVRQGWHVAVSYVIGFFVLLALSGWNPHAPHKTMQENVVQQQVTVSPNA